MTTLTIAPANTNTTTFRAWGSAISAAIAALGLVQTADTGQINWTTVTLTQTANTATGYEIWRFADSLQSTAPVYFKLEYGCANSTIYAGMWITTGTGSDGAGTITGTFFAGIPSTSVIVARQLLYVNINWFQGTQVFVMGDTSSLAICFWPTFAANNSAGTVMALERSRAFDGTSTGDGYSLIVSNTDGSSSTNATHSTPSYLANGYVTAITLQTAGTPYTGSLSNVVSGVLYPVPILTGSNLKIGAPSQYLMAIPRGDYLGNQTVAMTHYGVSKNWLTLGMGQSNSTGWGGPGISKSWIFRIT